MKKYRPYKTFPNDIVGKVVHVDNGDVTMIYHMPKHKCFICTTTNQYNMQDAFEHLTFTDGTPVGEEYEELVELVHDEVYLVRQHENEKWRPRHFCKRTGYRYYFYDAGLSSKTVTSVSNITYFNQVCEHTDAMMQVCTEPSEYLIKQS